MYNIADFLNNIGNYSFMTDNGEFFLLGTLVKEEKDNDNIVLRARVPTSDHHVYDAETINIYGSINNVKISLLACHVRTLSWRADAETVNAIFEIDKIVVGDHYKGTASIHCIFAEFQVLNYFYLNHFTPFLGESIRKEYFDSNPPLAATTQYGSVLLYPTLSYGSDPHQLTLKSVPYIKYSFDSPKTLDAAIAHMASIRNMFSFLGDGYIDLPSITYSTISNTNEPPIDDRVMVLLNQKARIPETGEHFLLTRDTIKKDFQKVVVNWLEFYENSVYIPALFFEIITNRSVGINEFLNLAQAVEIYSSYFRNKEAKTVCNDDPDAEIKDKPSLKHRLIDIFAFLQSLLGISNDQRDQLARIISRNRNFYTHYSRDGKEPAHKTISRMILLLRFVVLALVYKHIGIDDQTIQFCKKIDAYTAIDESIHIILNNEHRSKKVLE